MTTTTSSKPASKVECLPHLAKHGVTDAETLRMLEQRIWNYLEVDPSERHNVFVADVFPYPEESRTNNDKPLECDSKIHPPQPTPDMVPYQLLMVGIKPGASPRSQALRGTMIDTHGNDDHSTYVEVGVSTPNYIEVHSQTWPKAENGIHTLRDVQKRELKIRANGVYILPEFDGFTIRMFRYCGVDFFCSNYRFNGVCSWIPPVYQLWNANDGPSHEELFGDCKTSTSIYFFQILHPTLSMASFLNYPDHSRENGCIYYHGVVAHQDFPSEWIPDPEKSTSNLKEALELGKMYYPGQISLSDEDANQFLTEGYYLGFNNSFNNNALHPFLYSGESILIISTLINDDDPEEMIPVRVKILSAAYMYRQMIFDYMGSFRRSFAKLMEQANEDFTTLISRHPLVNTLSNSEMNNPDWMDQVAKAFDYQNISKTLNLVQHNANARRDWLRTLFFVLSPPHYKRQMAELIERVRMMYHNVSSWLIDEWAVDSDGSKLRRGQFVFKYMNRSFHYRPDLTYQQIKRFRYRKIHDYLLTKNYDLLKNLERERIRLSKQVITVHNPNYMDLKQVPDPRQADRDKIRDEKKTYIRHLRETGQIDLVLERPVMIPIGE